MEWTYKLNADNFTDYNLYLTDTPEYHKRVKNQGLLAGAMVLVLGLVMTLIAKEERMTTVIASVLGAVIIALLFPKIARGGSKMAVINAIRVNGDEMFREQTIRLSDEVIHVEVEEGEEITSRDFQKSEVTEVTEYKSILLLHFENGNLLIVPLASLDEEKKAALYAMKA